jgi:integrase
VSDSYISTTLRLNKTNVESLQPPARGVLVAWDDQLPGFHVRVTPTGTRTYYARGRLPGTRSPGDIKIGRHGVFTAEQARSRAKTILAMLAAGQDPRPLRLSRAEQEEVKRGNISFGELCDLYLAEHRKRDVTSSHRHSVDLWFDEYLKGELGHIPVRDLNTEHLRAFHQRHAHHPTTANRLVFWASVVCDFAEPRYRPLNSNPCWTMHQGMKKSLIEPYPEESRERCLTDEEVKRVAVAITEFEDDGRISATEADLLRVKMLTGCRSSELYRLKWPEVHLDQGYIELPEHKTKKKTGKKRVLPLSDAAALLIDRQPRRSEYVFYNEGGNVGGSPRESAIRTARESAVRPARSRSAGSTIFGMDAPTGRGKRGAALGGGWTSRVCSVGRVMKVSVTAPVSLMCGCMMFAVRSRLLRVARRISMLT